MAASFLTKLHNMRSTWRTVFVVTSCVCQLTILATSSSDDLSRQQKSMLFERLRRGGWGDSWSVIMPPAAAAKCYGQPCSYDADCCFGYQCTSFDEIMRRSRLVQYCTQQDDDPEMSYY